MTVNRQRLLELVEVLGKELDRRGMKTSVERLRVYYVALRAGVIGPGQKIDVQMSEHEVVDSMAILRLPPYATVYELRPRDAKLHNNLATLLVQQRSIDAAIYHYQRALEIDPGYETARKNLAALRARR